MKNLEFINPTTKSTNEQLQYFTCLNSAVKRELFDQKKNVITLHEQSYLMADENLYQSDRRYGYETDKKWVARGRLALGEGEDDNIYFVKIITVNNNDISEDVRQKIFYEMSMNHKYHLASTEDVLVSSDEETTEFFLIQKYVGLDAYSFLGENSLSVLDIMDLSVKFMQCVLEVYDKGDVHRDIKLPNFAIQRLSNGRLKVSIIDYDAIKPLNSEGCYDDQSNESTKEYLPPVYKDMAEKSLDKIPEGMFYRFGPLTDIYAALISAIEALNEILPEQEKMLSPKDKVFYNNLEEFFEKTLEDIEKSFTEVQPHPQLSLNYITTFKAQVEEMSQYITKSYNDVCIPFQSPDLLTEKQALLPNSDSNQSSDLLTEEQLFLPNSDSKEALYIQREIEKQDLIRRCFTVANDLHSQEEESERKIQERRILTQKEKIYVQKRFVRKLAEHAEYQLLAQMLAEKFPAEKATIDIKNIKNANFKAQKLATERNVERLKNRYHLMELKSKLEKFPDEKKAWIQAIIEAISEELQKPLDTSLIDAFQYIRQVDHILEKNTSTAQRKNFDAWHKRFNTMLDIPAGFETLLQNMDFLQFVWKKGQETKSLFMTQYLFTLHVLTYLKKTFFNHVTLNAETLTLSTVMKPLLSYMNHKVYYSSASSKETFAMIFLWEYCIRYVEKIIKNEQKDPFKRTAKAIVDESIQQLDEKIYLAETLGDGFIESEHEAYHALCSYFNQAYPYLEQNEKNIWMMAETFPSICHIDFKTEGKINLKDETIFLYSMIITYAPKLTKRMLHSTITHDEREAIEAEVQKIFSFIQKLPDDAKNKLYIEPAFLELVLACRFEKDRNNKKNITVKKLDKLKFMEFLLKNSIISQINVNISLVSAYDKKNEMSLNKWLRDIVLHSHFVSTGSQTAKTLILLPPQLLEKIFQGTNISVDDIWGFAYHHQFFSQEEREYERCSLLQEYIDDNAIICSPLSSLPSSPSSSRSSMMNSYSNEYDQLDPESGQWNRFEYSTGQALEHWLVENRKKPLSESEYHDLVHYWIHLEHQNQHHDHLGINSPYVNMLTKTLHYLVTQRIPKGNCNAKEILLFIKALEDNTNTNPQHFSHVLFQLATNRFDLSKQAIDYTSLSETELPWSCEEREVLRTYIPELLHTLIVAINNATKSYLLLTPQKANLRKTEVIVEKIFECMKPSRNAQLFQSYCAYLLEKRSVERQESQFIVQHFDKLWELLTIGKREKQKEDLFKHIKIELDFQLELKKSLLEKSAEELIGTKTGFKFFGTNNKRKNQEEQYDALILKIEEIKKIYVIIHSDNSPSSINAEAKKLYDDLEKLKNNIERIYDNKSSITNRRTL